MRARYLHGLRRSAQFRREHRKLIVAIAVVTDIQLDCTDVVAPETDAQRTARFERDAIPVMTTEESGFAREQGCDAPQDVPPFGQLDELPAARAQTERFRRVIVDIGSDLDLDATLRRVVTAAMELTRARHGALGVRGPDGTITSLLRAGMSPELTPRTGQLPAGKGVLGVPGNQPESLSRNDSNADRAAVRFPQRHAPARNALGVPITIRNTIFATLYLTDSRSGQGFTEADEIDARAVASAAAVAIENAQLFDRAITTATWIEAGRAITTAVLSDVEPHPRPLQLIADRVCALTDAEEVIVLIPDDADLPAQQVDTLVVSTAVGRHANEVIGQLVPVARSTTGEVFRSGTPLIAESFRHPIRAFAGVGQRPAIVVPLRCQDTVIGVIAVARGTDRPAFDARDLELMSEFAGHAEVALTLASARELMVLADRERIAHNLHDLVIQRVFAVGMDVQGTVARSRSPEVTDRLNRTLSDLQAIIEDIRTAIFGLQSPPGQARSFRQRIQQAVADMTDSRDITTTLQISGPLTVIGDVVAGHAEAVIMEAISNAVRHSGGTGLTVKVAVADELAIDITDNGNGIPPDNRRHSGLANMRRRAEQVGGHCTIGSPPAGGTHLHWTAPLADHRAGSLPNRRDCGEHSYWPPVDPSTTLNQTKEPA